MIGYCDPFDENVNGYSGDLFDGLVDILDDLPAGEYWGAGLQSPPDDLAGLSSLLCANTSNDSPKLLPNFSVPGDTASQSKGQPSTIEEKSSKTIPFCNDSSYSKDSHLLQTSSPVSVLECNSSSSAKKAMTFIPETFIPVKRSRSKRLRPSTSKQPLDPPKDTSSKSSPLNKDFSNSKNEDLMKNPNPVSGLECSSSCSIENPTSSAPDIAIAVKRSRSKRLRPSTSNQLLNTTKNTSCDVTSLQSKNSDLFKTSNPVLILESGSSCSVDKALPFVPKISIALKNSKSKFPPPSATTLAKCPPRKLSSSLTKIPVKRLRSSRPHPSTIFPEKYSCNNSPNSSNTTPLKHSGNKHQQPSTTLPVKHIHSKHQDPTTTLPVKHTQSKHQDPSTMTLCLVIPLNSFSSAFEAVNPLAVSEEMQIHPPKNLNPVERKQKTREREIFSILASAKEDKKHSFQQPVATRKCMHCGVTKTSLWRKGPMGPKTLCNACWHKHKYGCTSPTGNPTIATILASIKSSISCKKIAEFSQKDGMETATKTNPPFIASLPLNSLEKGVDLRNKAGLEASISPFVASPNSNSSKKVTKMGKKAGQEVPMVASRSIVTALPANSHKKNPLQQSVEVKKCTHCEAIKTCRWREGSMGPNTLCNGCGLLYKHGHLPSTTASTPIVASLESSSSKKKVLEIKKRVGQDTAMAESPTLCTSLQKISQKKHSLQQPIDTQKCMHCEATRTPKWRKGPKGPHTLCNACGMRYWKAVLKMKRKAQKANGLLDSNKEKGKEKLK